LLPGSIEKSKVSRGYSLLKPFLLVSENVTGDKLSDCIRQNNNCLLRVYFDILLKICTVQTVFFIVFTALCAGSVYQGAPEWVTI
jgi:hypothetical protein